MQENRQPNERRPEEYVLFAITFVGLGTAGGGMIISSVFLAVSGVCLALLALLGFMGRALLAD
jgi:hypothetical protein